MNAAGSDEGDAPSRLARRLGTFDAVVVGLGSMIGAGIFAALGPAADAAGGGLLVGLVVAGIVAACNATSSARLAARFPSSGGAYLYGRERLGPIWGFLAGWAFVAGKTASCAAMALTFGAYAVPDLVRPLAVGAVVALTVVNLLGVRKAAWLTRVIVAVVLGSLAAVLAGAATADPSTAHVGSLTDGGTGGILEAAALLFFAFAGYARIATLGEEVRDPGHTIPRAVAIALGTTLVVYVTVAGAALVAVGPRVLAGSTTPLERVVDAGTLDWAEPAVRVGAAVASLGVLLTLLAGVSRTVFAMAAAGDLPPRLGAVHSTRRIPHVAQVVIGVVVVGIVLAADVRGVIGFSSFAVLGYYTVANAAALTLGSREGVLPRAIAALGIVGCVVLAFALPWPSVVGGVALVAAGALVWWLRDRSRLRPAPGR